MLYFFTSRIFFSSSSIGNFLQFLSLIKFRWISSIYVKFKMVGQVEIKVRVRVRVRITVRFRVRVRVRIRVMI